MPGAPTTAVHLAMSVLVPSQRIPDQHVSPDLRMFPDLRPASRGPTGTTPSRRDYSNDAAPNRPSHGHSCPFQMR
ncbi:hypothetical protein [Candidatus Frankia alpina]|uniref:Uncharacterized protein n=1 Tax=Candidatus Frankia alpina TaxID=2699483 RepID=A0A4S5ETV4_9ACTN|nr:hypothetical protein [Candidatus Frankia alpina]THJ75938.1 hypothetical protein E7Y31_02535 [Candidatus Frankia alpina]